MEKDDVKDVLGKFIQEHYSQLRHYETQRSTVSNLLIIVAAAILAFVTYDKALTRTDLPLTILLFTIGLFGAAFCIKYYERASNNYQRIQTYRSKLDEVLFGSQLINSLVDEATKQHGEEFPKLYKGSLSWLKVHRLWVIFHLFVSLLGLILTILALVGARTPVSSP